MAHVGQNRGDGSFSALGHVGQALDDRASADGCCECFSEVVGEGRDVGGERVAASLRERGEVREGRGVWDLGGVGLERMSG